ncbi:hypothetical protein OKT76_09025 [Providencia rettgeri]|uniref:hypothetical protein n=1 Tax=Providencia TaxID=586 RepID=UPI00226F3E7F|nr:MULTISPECIES: hypothetical protein [Providencia]MCX9095869.1 hypothetical protein [Providencia rettgeri]
MSECKVNPSCLNAVKIILLLIATFFYTEAIKVTSNDYKLAEYIKNSILYLFFFGLIYLSSYYESWKIGIKNNITNSINILIVIIVLLFVYFYSINLPQHYDSFASMAFTVLGCVLAFNISNLSKHLLKTKRIKIIVYFSLILLFLVITIWGINSQNEKSYNFIFLIAGTVISTILLVVKKIR